MRKLVLAGLIAGFGLATPAFAGTLDEMVGTWEWEGYTIEVTECGDTVCAEVVDGPNNVGMEMFQSAPESDGDGYTAEVAHPATGDTYYSRFTVDGDVWSMEGCTSSGACAQGDFIRA